MSNMIEYTVSELSSDLRKTVEEKFSYVALRGEISGFKRHSSGHCYFSLKDKKSVIDAVMWKGSALKLPFVPQDGIEILAKGKVTTYAGRSKYQIVLEDMQPAGEGALMALLEALKKRLSAEGVFSLDNKKPIPFLPKVIAVITSPTGAVIRDILHRLKERTFPHIYVFPVVVQGELSARQISYAIRFLNNLEDHPQIKKPDLIILARGGGSIEDLWSFNEEIVVRSIFNSQIPIISAVGHETDFTLSDLVADKRAPTPTAAAEMAVPVRQDWLDHIQACADRLILAQKNHLEGEGAKIDNLSLRLDNALRGHILQYKASFERKSSRLRPYLVMNFLAQIRQSVQRSEQRLYQSMQHILSLANLSLQKNSDLSVRLSKNLQKSMDNILYEKKKTIGNASKMLESLSYHNILKRGYAVIHSKNNDIITHKKQAKDQGVAKITFHDGTVEISAKE